MTLNETLKYNPIDLLLQSSNHWRPIIIYGVARSGTRMISDIMNSHDNIRIEQEMFGKVLDSFVTMIDEIDASHKIYSSRKERIVDTKWKNGLPALTHLFLAVASKGALNSSNNKFIEYHGIKTPGLERRFEVFENIFIQNPPLYIYALRDVGSVWKSWKARGFNVSMEQFAKRYQRSLRQALKIKRRANARFSVFQLNEYIEAADKSIFVSENILSPLSISDKIAWPDQGIENRNSATRAGFSIPGDEITISECKQLEHDKVTQDLANELVSS